MLSRLPDAQWNESAAAHLLNRAAFSGTPAEIKALVEAGLDTALARLIDYDRIPDATPAPLWAKPDPDRLEKMQILRMATEEQRREMERNIRIEEAHRLLDLRDWWLRRMTSGPRPFQEKMTLFWHGHFATSIEKVRDPYLMWLQNETLRKNALGNWHQLLVAVSKDPAMLIWLDNARSNKNKPNENYAREVMELFSLGEGHYTEQDIKEAARALTGWDLTPDRQSFLDVPNKHDMGEKIFLGLKGKLGAEDVLRQITKQSQANLFITARLWNFFAGELPDPKLNEALAAAFVENRQQFGPFMKVVFSSEEFYSPRIRRIQVKSPVFWLVSSCRLLERDLPPAPVANNMLRSLRQELFAPPNVKGWDGGIAWITTNSLLSRYNYAASLVEGTAPMNAATGGRKIEMMMDRLSDKAAALMGPATIANLVPPDDFTSPQKAITALTNRFIQGPLKPQRAEALQNYLQSVPALNESVLRQAVRLIMSTPDYQLS